MSAALRGDSGPAGASVADSRALGGALLALGGSVVALSAYYALGRVVRRLPTLIGAWLASLVPLFCYSGILWLFVALSADCAPGCMS